MQVEHLQLQLSHQKSTLDNAKYPKRHRTNRRRNVYKSRDLKGGGVKLNVTCCNFQRCVWGTFPNVASHSVLLQKITYVPSISASKNLHYSPHTHTPKIWPGRKADVSIITKARLIQCKTSFGCFPLAQRSYSITSRDVIGRPRCPFSVEGRSMQMWQWQCGEVAPSRGRMGSLLIFHKP